MTGRRTAAVACSVVAMSVALPGAVGTAVANPQVGSCTKSYTLYDKAGLSFDPAAVAIFDVIDTNHNGLICFKPYPNGDHAGHAGNLVDDKAGPH